MPTSRIPWRSDGGETLIELVVSIAILGIAGVAIATGLMVSVRSSVQHRNDASGDAYVRSFAEAIQTDVDVNGSKTCANALSDYNGLAVPDLPSGYTRSVTAVKSWNGSSWVGCTTDGIQRLDLKVSTTGDAAHKAEETLSVILRRPCSGTANTAGDDPCS